MDLADHLRVIVQNWWKILLISLLVAAGVYSLSSRKPNVYEAETTMAITSGSTNNGAGSTKDQSVFLAQTYAELAVARPVVAKAVSRSGLAINTSTAQARLSVNAATDTAFLTITAQGPTPRSASRLANSLAVELQREVARQQDLATTQDLDSVNAEIALIQAQLTQVPPDSPQRSELDTRYAALLDAAVARRTQPRAFIEVVSRAEPADAPTLPRPARDALLGFIAALIITAELSVLLHALSDRLTGTLDSDTVREAFGLPVLAMVPASKGSHLIEAFRGLRVNLASMRPDQRPQTIAIVSTHPDAGKSFTAVNLAMVTAGQATGVLLIDADLRRPTLHQRLGFPKAPGLTDVLGGAELYGALYSVGVDSGYEADEPHRFLAVPSGVPVLDPIAVVSHDLIPRIAEGFERLPGLVIFDTPPLALFSDALAIGAQCDAVILVLDAKRTRLKSTRDTIASLQAADAMVLGIVVNRVKRRSEVYDSYR